MQTAGAGVTADTVPPEDAVRHGSITLANAVLPQRIRVQSLSLFLRVEEGGREGEGGRGEGGGGRENGCRQGRRGGIANK